MQIQYFGSCKAMPASVSRPALRPTINESIPYAALSPGRLAIGAAYAVLLAIYAHHQTQPANLSLYAYDYDEGVYAQTAWALGRGHRLFAEVFSSQPPLIPYLLVAVFALTDPSVPAARLLMVILSMITLIGVGVLAASVGGWMASLAAMMLLASNPTFGEMARTISFTPPAAAFATMAVVFAARYADRRERVWWTAAVAALVAGSLTKLAALVALPVLATVLLVVHHRQFFSRPLAADIAILVVPLLTVWGLLLSVFGPAQVVDQMVLFHARAKDAFPHDLTSNLQQLQRTLSENPASWILATVGFIALWAGGQKTAMLSIVVWFLSVLMALMAHSPLFSHHWTLFLPPAMVLGGVGLSVTIATAGKLIAGRNGVARGLGRGACALVIAAILWPAHQLISHLGATGDSSWSWTEARPAVMSIQATTPPDSVIVTDAQMIALAANRALPPALVDTSTVRIASGYLTLSDLQAATERDRPTAVLFWTGRLETVPGFRAWVESHFAHQQSFGPGRDLYVTKD